MKKFWKKIHQGGPWGPISILKEIHFQENFIVKILWNYFRMIELSITDSAKKKLVKSDILGLRYKQFSGGGVKKIFFQKKKKYDFFNFWNLDVSKMDWNNGFNSSFFVGFPNNPNLDVSGHFGCKFFFWWLPLSAKAVSIYRLTGSRELNVKILCLLKHRLQVCTATVGVKEGFYCYYWAGLRWEERKENLF